MRWSAGLFAIVTTSLLFGCATIWGIDAVPPAPSDGGDSGTDAGTDGFVPQLTSNKVDILFAIDNSRSMGDKQALLAKALPSIIAGLVAPIHGQFAPVVDMHVGIVSSSLGGGGAEQTGAPICQASALEPVFKTFNAHNDDKGHLINRQRPTSANGTEDPVAAAKPLSATGGDFLAWLPSGMPAPNVKAETNKGSLTADFQTLVLGTQEYGCGLEAQLESWYRFLIQPDPYASIKLDKSPIPVASLIGTDVVLLQERADFLRPDSVVIIVQVTDEEDSWSDPLALNGRGWTTRAAKFPASPTGLLPRGTSPCNAIEPSHLAGTGPNDANCTSCGFAGNMANGQPIASDPNCSLPCGPNCFGYYMSKEDNLNIRYVDDVKRRYGFDFQFPVQRYVDGLTSMHVPNRDGEHPGGTGPYQGDKNCLNPLFAKKLPTTAEDTSLCQPTAELGPRNSSLVYYVHVGGVPWQLLGASPKTLTPSLNADDWTKIVGRDPDHYDYTGIDPHMIESYLPRIKANAASIPFLSRSLADPGGSDAADPIHGREWDTTLSPLGLDLQFACTFDITPKDCTDPTYGNSCDCVGPATNASGVPLCAPGVNSSMQNRAKTYPTRRELRVAKGMGDHGVAGSLCAPGDPFAPAFSALFNRLNGVLPN